MNTKGELTTQQIVILTITLISFVVLLIFLFILNPAETNSKQICHNSVILEDKGKGLVGSLDCKTNYLCVSGGGSCTDFSSATTSNVDSTKKEEVMKALANEMSDCWWMFGEGKIDYSTAGAFEKVQCSLCSIVKFDEKTQKALPKISYQDFYNYLRTTQKTNSQSYLQYLYSSNNFDFIKELKLTNYLGNNIDTSKEYFILTGMSKEGYLSITSTNLNPFSLENIPYPVVIMEKTVANYNAVGCDEFLTKAS